MVEIISAAKNDLKQFELEERERLLDCIEEKLDGTKNQQNISYISKQEFGIEFQRLKLKEEGLDHRVYFKFIDSEVLVFAVRHRDYAYSQKDMKEAEKKAEQCDLILTLFRQHPIYLNN